MTENTTMIIAAQQRWRSELKGKIAGKVQGKGQNEATHSAGKTSSSLQQAAAVTIKSQFPAF